MSRNKSAWSILIKRSCFLYSRSSFSRIESWSA
jgi:hypothetical protein